MNKLDVGAVIATARIDLEAAEAARHRLAAIVESSDDAIISKDLNGIVTSWNRGAERIFGYSPDEMIGRSITTLIPADHQDEEPRILERIRRGERIEHYETIRQRKDGSLIDISLTVSPIKDDSGRVIGASKIARNIGERKRAERVLAKRIDEQTALFEFTDRLYRARSANDIYDASLDAITRALACERASILLFDRSGTMRFAAWRGLSAAYRDAVEGHCPWPHDVADPEPIYIEDTASLEADAAVKAAIEAEGIRAAAFIPVVMRGRLIGKFMAYYGETHDFTPGEIDLALTLARQLGFSLERLGAEEARRDAEKALRESERRLKHALRSGQMGAWEWDIVSGAVIWSTDLEAIHGLEPGTFGSTFEDFRHDIHPEDASLVLETIERALSAKTDYHVIYRINRRDGAIRYLEAFGRFVSDGSGAVRKLAGVCMDVTERLRAEDQRNLLVAELGHRVKNTLATVLSIAQQTFAKDKPADEARTSFSARIQALAQTHERLAQSNWSGVLLETLLLDELEPYRREDGANVRVFGPAVMLTPKQALTLGMAVHELATNAAKYGALSTKSGAVDVVWQFDPKDKKLKIRWSETGGPPVAKPERSGFGRLLLERAIAADVRGDVRLDFAPLGVSCEIQVPLGDE
jgi:PAS domain S-box-containing protein